MFRIVLIVIFLSLSFTNLSKANLVLETNYFILNTNIKIDDKDFHIKSHIYYSNESPKVIRRKLGEYL